MSDETKNQDIEEELEEEIDSEEKEAVELSPQEIENKRLKCLNTRLRIGMIQVGMESLQKDLQQMNRELGEQRSKLAIEYPELKKVMNCPEDHEINLETGEFVVSQQQQIPN